MIIIFIILSIMEHNSIYFERIEILILHLHQTNYVFVVFVMHLLGN